MKHILATTFIVASTLSAFAEEPAPAEGDVKVTTNSDGSGKATITIEANGKKEVRQIDFTHPVKSVFSVVSSDTEKEKPGTWLGVASDELSEELAAQLPIAAGTGVLVRHVAEESPAAKVGLAKNDVLVKLDDQIITDARQLQKLVKAKKAGDQVELTVLRKGQEQTLRVTLEQSTRADWGSTPPDHPVIDVGSGKLAVEDILKNYAAAAGSAGGRANLLITSPDGKVITNLDTGTIKIAPMLRQADQALEDSNITGEVLKQLQKALADVQAGVARAGDEATKAMKRAEEAAVRATEAAKRAEEKMQRDSERDLKSEAKRRADEAATRAAEAARRAEEKVERDSKPQAN